MIREVLTAATIKVGVEADSWEDVVYIAGELLYQNGFVEKRYIDNMIATVKTFGPYIVLIKGVALAHARPEDGAKKIGLSLVVMKTPVNFGNEENDPVKLVFALSAVDNSSHLALIGEMGELFDNEEALLELSRCTTEQEVLDVIQKTV